MKREGFTQSGIRQWGSVHCVASSTITMGSCVPCERKEVTCVLDDVASVATIYPIKQTNRQKDTTRAFISVVCSNFFRR